jgi:deoxyribonuclease-4
MMLNDFHVGLHTSIGGGLCKSISHAVDKGCDCLQIFSRNPRGWQVRPLGDDEIKIFRNAREQSGLWPLVIHSVYLINLAAQDPAMQALSRAAFREELERGIRLGADYLVVHPGNPKSVPVEAGILTAVESIREAARGLKLKGAATSARRAGKSNRLSILVENTAGQGSSIGCAFEQVAEIIAGLDDLPVDVCLDTAHTYASGYDISTETGFRSTLKAIDRSFGFDRIKVVHCNDSKVGLGSRVDRHEHIGLGHIGAEAFRRITQHPKFRAIPFILETPVDKEHDAQWNMTRIRELSVPGVV